MRLTATLLQLLVALTLLGFGIYGLYYEVLSTGFAKVPGDLGDARLINLFLEHNYLYLFGDRPLNFWSPTWLFYPLRNGLAMSDVMTGTAPIYAVFRLLGFDYVLAYQSWAITCAVLNFICTVWLFLRLRCHWLGALAGSYIFAFGMHRVGFLNHAQLTPSFFCPLVLLCLYRLTAAAKPAYLPAAAAGLLASLQLWAGFYLGWFLLFTIAVTLLIWLFRPRAVASLRTVVIAQWQALLLGAVLFAALSAPLAAHYLRIVKVAGPREWGEILMYMPQPWGLIYGHQDSWMYSWLFPIVTPHLPIFSEKALFAGFIALLTPWVMLYYGRSAAKRPLIAGDPRVVPVATYLAIVMTLICLRFPGDISLWWLPFNTFPGASAIRAIGRMVHLSMLPVGLCLAAGCTWLVAWRRRLGTCLAALLLVGVVAENWTPYGYAFTKAEHLARVAALTARLERAGACDAFFAKGPGDVLVHIDAMWVSLLTDKPTFNGYSGFEPKNYRSFGLATTATTEMGALQAWQQQGGLAANFHSCLIPPG